MTARNGQYTEEPQLLRMRTRLRDLMERRGLTAAELAERCGCSRQVAWQWAQGMRIPSASSLIRLSRALDVPADWLLGATPQDLAARVRSLAGVEKDPVLTGAHFRRTDVGM